MCCLAKKGVIHLPLLFLLLGQMVLSVTSIHMEEGLHPPPGHESVLNPLENRQSDDWTVVDQDERETSATHTEKADQIPFHFEDSESADPYSLHQNHQKQQNRRSLVKTWGSHPLGPLEKYSSSAYVNNGEWTAYFHDQAIALIYESRDGVILNCTLQEVIETWEQQAAMLNLGRVMPLVPVSLPQMVHLVTLCGSLSRGTLLTLPTSAQEPTTSPWWMGTSAFHGILPGTLWCGMGDQANTYHDLGAHTLLDNCCRAHDHCPIKLRPMMTKYGVTNFGIKTKSHCACDLEFFRCLKAVGNDIANAVGKIYFNYLKVQCVDAASTKPLSSLQPPPLSASVNHYHRPFGSGRALGASGSTQWFREVEKLSLPPRLECATKDREGRCRLWVPNPKGFTTKLHITDLNLTY